MRSLNSEDADSYIDLFFERSPINSTILIFVDDDAKEDFSDMAVDLGLIPDIKELCEGESKDDKLRRSLKDVDILTKKNNINIQKKPKVEPDFEEKVQRKIKGLQKEIAKLREKIENESDSHTRDEINKKIMYLTNLADNKNFTV